MAGFKYVSCICKETLLNKMAKLHDELSFKTCSNSLWREKSRECKCELLGECHRVRCEEPEMVTLVSDDDDSLTGTASENESKICLAMK